MSHFKCLLYRSLLCVLAAHSSPTAFAQTTPPKATAPAVKKDEVVSDLVRKGDEQFVASFNAAKVDDLTTAFLAEGEYIDEEGTIYQGRKEIKELLTAFFARFPETKLSVEIESIRTVGPVTIEEGIRTMTMKDGATQASFRFIAIRTKTDEGWKIASFRDFASDAAPSANERLQPLAWLAGDWVNEGADGSVAISFQWSPDKNYLLGDFTIKSSDGVTKKSSERFGWDASTGKIRSWLFDSDGGFAEGLCTLVEDGLVVKFNSVNPDGSTASSTISLRPKDKDAFLMSGTDRIVGDSREPDFELNVVRRPPTAGK